MSPLRAYLLLFCLAHAQVAPDCVYAGRRFSGSNDDHHDLTNVCQNDFGGAFSVAFTAAAWGGFRGWARVFDFGAGAPDKNVGFTMNNEISKLELASYTDNTDGSRQGLSLWDGMDVKHRYLMSISASGHVKAWRDGSMDFETTWNPLPQATRTLLVAKSFWSSDPVFKGVIEDFWIWHSEVNWTSATTTTTMATVRVAPDCVYEGKHFSGSNDDHHDLTNHCQNDFGGAFSVAFTVAFDALGGWSRVFDFGIGAQDRNYVLALDPNEPRLHWAHVPGFGWSTAERLIMWDGLNVKRRYLLSMSASGDVKAWRDGSLDFEAAWTPLPQVARTLLVAKSFNSNVDPLFNGIIEDFWMWYSEVDWASAATTNTSTTTTSRTCLP